MNTYCHITAQVNEHTNQIDNPIDWAIEEIIEELLTHGSIKIGREETHVMDLYQYGEEEDLRNLVFMTVRNPENAKAFAKTIIHDCATYYFNEIEAGLVIEYIEEKNSLF